MSKDAAQAAWRVTVTVVTGAAIATVLGLVFTSGAAIAVACAFLLVGFLVTLAITLIDLFTRR